MVHLGLQANVNVSFDWWNHGETANAVENVPGWMQYVALPHIPPSSSQPHAFPLWMLYGV
jgi:hypothetical protein